MTPILGQESEVSIEVTEAINDKEGRQAVEVDS
jgi:hypothetical protein